MRGSSRVLDGLHLRIAEGEHTAILGPNGCGKSTLIKALTRELHPYGGEGRVRIFGRERWAIADLRTLIGVVSEDPRTPLLGSPTGLDLAVSGLLGTYGVTAQHSITSAMWEKAREALARADAAYLASQTIETMSTGERRRVWISRALVSEPKALVLDEPTNGLDIRAAHEFHQTVVRLAASGVTILLVTHHLEEVVPSIRRIILMNQGKVVADGSRDELLTLPWLSRTFELQDPGLLRRLEAQLARFRENDDSVQPAPFDLQLPKALKLP